jgi:hypothetical protein
MSRIKLRPARDAQQDEAPVVLNGHRIVKSTVGNWVCLRCAQVADKDRMSVYRETYCRLRD